MYEDAYRRGLMAVYAPVERRKYGGKSVKEKHVEDVWELLCTIRDLEHRSQTESWRPGMEKVFILRRLKRPSSEYG